MSRLYSRFLERMFVNPSSLLHQWRAARMRAFLDRTAPPPGARIIDLGGREMVWNLIDHDFHVTLVNLPGDVGYPSGSPRFTHVEHDACDLRDLFADGAFDLTFSNSTIEHVGDDSQQEALAREIRRLAPAYWVQTPSDRCPIEVHCGVPFYFRLPERVRRRLMDHWRRNHPDVARGMEGTRVLGRRRLRELFPDGRLYVERKLGVEKSLSMFRTSSESSKVG